MNGTSGISTRFTSLAPAGGLYPQAILGLSEDPSGGLWIGTNGGGLNRFDPATGEVYREGITEITPHDVTGAEEPGHVIKLLGIARRTGHGIEQPDELDPFYVSP